MKSFLITGALLGLSAGFSPGPLFALVISETLLHGIWSGIKVALAPLITDLPIIIVSLFFLSQVTDSNLFLGLVSLSGGVFVLSMGYENLRVKTFAREELAGPPRSLLRGVMVNFLSPHPYLFWITVGAPIFVRASKISSHAPFLFVFTFYLMLVGSKLWMAVVTARSKVFLTGRTYIYMMRFLGVLLWFLAIILVRDGLRFLGIFT